MTNGVRSTSELSSWIVPDGGGPIAERVRAASEPVASDSAQQSDGMVPFAAALQFAHLVIKGEPRLRIFRHWAPPQKEISPSRQASGLIMMVRE